MALPTGGFGHLDIDVSALVKRYHSLEEVFRAHKLEGFHKITFRWPDEVHSIYVSSGHVIGANSSGAVGRMPGILFFLDTPGLDQLNDTDPLGAYPILEQHTEDGGESLKNLYNAGMLSIGAHIQGLLSQTPEEGTVTVEVAPPATESLKQWKIIETPVSRFASVCNAEHMDILAREEALGLPKHLSDAILSGSAEGSDAISTMLNAAASANASLHDVRQFSFGVTWNDVLESLQKHIDVGTMKLSVALGEGGESVQISGAGEEFSSEAFMDYEEEDDPFDVEMNEAQGEVTDKYYTPTGSLGKIAPEVVRLQSVLTPEVFIAATKLASFNDNKEDELRRVEPEIEAETNRYLALANDISRRRKEQEWNALEDEDETGHTSDDDLLTEEQLQVANDSFFLLESAEVSRAEINMKREKALKGILSNVEDHDPHLAASINAKLKAIAAVSNVAYTDRTRTKRAEAESVKEMMKSDEPKKSFWGRLFGRGD